MTLIECFTDFHIDNIAACLHLRPEKLIMVGNKDEMHHPVKRYRELLQRRRQRTEITLCDVQGKDIGDISAVLKKLVRDEADCVIDLTGGDEPVIMAVGSMLAGLDSRQRQNIRVQKFDHDRGVILDCINNNHQLPSKLLTFTVEELVLLHGGSLHPDSYQPPADFRPGDLEPLWRIASDMPRNWNRAISLLNEFERRSESKLQIDLPLELLRGSVPNFEEKEPIVRDLLDQFRRLGIINDHSNRYALRYTYSSSILRHCTQKAGNVLEVKTLLEGRAVLDHGAPFFQDCLMGVSIDWDGVIHSPADRVAETRNEIDVVLMHGTTPLFISCKNGNIGEELYKLHTVASRFGGPYARKMLIATELDQKADASNRAFIQRAIDMDITLVTNAAELPRKEWEQTLKEAMR